MSNTAAGLDCILSAQASFAPMEISFKQMVTAVFCFVRSYNVTGLLHSCMYADSVCVCVCVCVCMCDNTDFLFPPVISKTVLLFACYDRLLLLAVERREGSSSTKRCVALYWLEFL